MGMMKNGSVRAVWRNQPQKVYATMPSSVPNRLLRWYRLYAMNASPASQPRNSMRNCSSSSMCWLGTTAASRLSGSPMT